MKGSQMYNQKLNENQITEISLISNKYNINIFSYLTQQQCGWI